MPLCVCMWITAYKITIVIEKKKKIKNLKTKIGSGEKRRHSDKNYFLRELVRHETRTGIRERVSTAAEPARRVRWIRLAREGTSTSGGRRVQGRRRRGGRRVKKKREPKNATNRVTDLGTTEIFRTRTTAPRVMSSLSPHHRPPRRTATATTAAARHGSAFFVFYPLPRPVTWSTPPRTVTLRVTTTAPRRGLYVRPGFLSRKTRAAAALRDYRESVCPCAVVVAVAAAAAATATAEGDFDWPYCGGSGSDGGARGTGRYGTHVLPPRAGRGGLRPTRRLKNAPRPVELRRAERNRAVRGTGHRRTAPAQLCSPVAARARVHS